MIRYAPHLLALSFMSLAACRDEKKPEAPPSGSAVERLEPPPWDAGEKTPAPPQGMVWIPPGALVAGTPPGKLPRIADEEMAGEQVILKGFFISIYPYPNEEAAIPLVNVTRDEAAALCEEEQKRLCTELEWERACKGPKNHTYEYGDTYRPEPCGTGAEPRMLPSGIRVGCQSDFGTRDMHGGVWEWTSSSWGRGEKRDLGTVRGGNARAGELVGRCANAMGRPADSKSGDVGFRCCAGPRNEAEVVVVVDRRPKLVRIERLEKKRVQAVETALAESPIEGLSDPSKVEFKAQWYWHPIGNEELIVLAACTGRTASRTCGAVVARLDAGKASHLTWVDAGKYLPTVQTDVNPRFLWVYGGDVRSHFRRLVVYAWGRVRVDRLERNVRPRPQKRKR